MVRHLHRKPEKVLCKVKNKPTGGGKTARESEKKNMEKTKLQEIIETMAIKVRLCKIYKNEERYKDNFRECPFKSELTGMEETLNILGIPFEYEFNKDVTEITAIKAAGIVVEI